MFLSAVFAVSAPDISGLLVQPQLAKDTISAYPEPKVRQTLFDSYIVGFCPAIIRTEPGAFNTFIHRTLSKSRCFPFPLPSSLLD